VLQLLAAVPAVEMGTTMVTAALMAQRMMAMTLRGEMERQTAREPEAKDAMAMMMWSEAAGRPMDWDSHYYNLSSYTIIWVYLKRNFRRKCLENVYTNYVISRKCLENV
jgi:hypothetical protein